MPETTTNQQEIDSAIIRGIRTRSRRIRAAPETVTTHSSATFRAQDWLVAPISIDGLYYSDGRISTPTPEEMEADLMKITDYKLGMGWKRISPYPKKDEMAALMVRIRESVALEPQCVCGQCGNAYTFNEDSVLIINTQYEARRPIMLSVYAICENCHHTYDPCQKCSVCGERHVKRHHIYNDGNQYDECVCNMCLKNSDEYEKCSSCGVVVAKGTFGEYFSGEGDGDKRLLCPSCVEATNVCPTCGHYRTDPYSYYAADGDAVVKKHVCRNCGNTDGALGRCGYCQELFELGILELINGTYVCHRCARALKEQCSNCGGPNGTTNDLCMNCQTGYIREWNYAPPGPTFHGEGNVFYGMELEVTGFPASGRREQAPTGNKLKCALELHGISNNEADFYLMKDATINGGFEITFQPRTIDDWLGVGPRLLDTVRDIVRKYGGVSYKGGCCGIHIHRSREDLTSDEMIGTLLYSLQAIEPYAYIVAQRTGITNAIDMETEQLTRYEYGNFRRQKEHFPDNQVGGITARDIISKKENWMAAIADDHHAAITFGVGKPTIELRIFRGTLAVDTQLAYLSFYSLLSDWSKTVSLSNLMEWSNSRSWAEFGKFVNGQGTEQAHRLITYAKTKGLVL